MEVGAAWAQNRQVWVLMVALLPSSAYFVPAGKFLDFSELSFLTIKVVLIMPILSWCCENSMR